MLTVYIVFVYSTVCHEAAHAWVAHKLGDSTAYHGGQVSLDPIPHIRREPWGMVVVPLVLLLSGWGMMGWASAPIDPVWAARNPRHSALVALAGPAANFLLCIASAAAIFVGARNGVFLPSGSFSTVSFVIGEPGTHWESVAQVLTVIFMLNLLLGIFNLLPVPPLDGSNIPLLFLKERAAEAYQQILRHPTFSFICLMVVFRTASPLIQHVRAAVGIECYRWFFPEWQ